MLFVMEIYKSVCFKVGMVIGLLGFVVVRIWRFIIESVISKIIILVNILMLKSSLVFIFIMDN